MSLTLKEWSIAADTTTADWLNLIHRTPMTFAAYGGFGSGTITVEVSPDGGTNTYLLADLECTDDFVSGPVTLPQGYSIRPIMAGSTTPTVTVELVETVAR